MDRGTEAAGRPPGNVVLDLDGVVYLSGEPIPGAGDALAELAQRGIVVVFATNNSTRTAADVAAHIRESTGFPARPDQVVTSGMAAAAMAEDDDVPAFVFGGPGLAATLEEAGISTTTDPEAARSVFIGLDFGLTYARLRDATTAVLRGARFIATNLDVTFPTPQGLWPGAGTLAAAVAAASGRRPEVAGKPHGPMRRAVAARLGRGRTWMVGDRPETDVAFARAAGWSPVLVLTGVTDEASEIPAGLEPDHLLGSIAELPSLLVEPGS